MANRIISCPKCENEFELDSVLETTIRSEIQDEAKIKAQEQEEMFQERESALKEKQLQLEADEKSLNEKLNQELAAKEKTLQKEISLNIQKQYDARQKVLEKELEEKDQKIQDAHKHELELRNQQKKLESREKEMELEIHRKLDVEKERIALEAQERALKKANREHNEVVKQLEQDVRDKEAKLKAANQQELELRKQRKQIEDEKQNQELEIARKLDQERKKIAEQAVQKAEEAQELKLRESEDQIRRMQEQINLLKRRSETGSQEAQGEALEGILLERLQLVFPSDTFEEIRRGQRGADIIQTVHNPAGKACGKILWEAKNAQNFSPQWVDKLKDDLQRAGANIPVLVTMAMPNGITRCDQYNDVWVSELPSAVGLSMALRQILIQVEREKLVTAGQESLKDLIYDYFTSPEFGNRIKSIAGAYQQMMYDLDKEKSAMERLWGKRERQIKTVVKQLAGMQGEIEGMLGNEKALPHMGIFELEAGDIEDEE